MLEIFKSHIAENFDFLSSKKLLLACSGGLDSVVLTHLIDGLSLDFGIAHCNFSLRGAESDADEDFVDELSKKMNVPFYSERFQTKEYAKKNGVSVQMAARTLRYEWFENMRKAGGYDYILTAHHADDDIETFFINLSRGTGLRGLTGIPMLNQYVLRPLLAFSRKELLDYAKSEAISWREDSSNASPDYLRNKLRLQVLPAFLALSERTLANFKNTQEHLRASKYLVDDYMVLIRNLLCRETPEGLQIDSSKLKELPNIKALLFELLKPFNFTDFDAAFKLLEGQSGKQLLSPTHRLLKDRDLLLVTEIPKKESDVVFYIEKDTKRLAEPIELKLESINSIGEIGDKIIYVDTEKLSYPLTIRKWREGDVFQPFGMKGKKKLSKFFKDEKLSLAAKEKIWVLCSDGEIIWVIGLRADDRFKVRPETKKIIRISTL